MEDDNSKNLYCPLSLMSLQGTHRIMINEHNILSSNDGINN